MPCLVLADVEVEVLKFDVYTQTPAATVMLMGDDVLQGYRIAQKDTVTALLAPFMQVSTCFNAGGKCQHLAQNSDLDLMALHPKSSRDMDRG